jgi:hypothetical protein
LNRKPPVYIEMMKVAVNSETVANLVGIVWTVTRTIEARQPETRFQLPSIRNRAAGETDGEFRRDVIVPSVTVSLTCVIRLKDDAISREESLIRMDVYKDGCGVFVVRGVSAVAVRD